MVCPLILSLLLQPYDVDTMASMLIVMGTRQKSVMMSNAIKASMAVKVYVPGGQSANLIMHSHKTTVTSPARFGDLTSWGMLHFLAESYRQ